MAQDPHASDPFSDPEESADPSAPGAEPEERAPLVPVRLSIMGRTYPLRVEPKDAPLFQEMGAHVNSLLRRFRSEHPTQSETTLHVLACLEIAGDLWKARAELEDARTESEDARAELEQIRLQLEETAQSVARQTTDGAPEFREQVEQDLLDRVNLRLEDLLEKTDPDR